jgi:general secretion pathway protein F
MARFAHTISTMMSGGMTLLAALDMSRGVTGSALVDDSLTEAGEAVRQGEQLAPNLAASGLFNPMVVDMIGVGERSGEIEHMLERSAEALDEEVRSNVETMAGLLEPIMILAMAGVVLFVVLAVLLPVFEMNQMVR